MSTKQLCNKLPLLAATTLLLVGLVSLSGTILFLIVGINYWQNRFYYPGGSDLFWNAIWKARSLSVIWISCLIFHIAYKFRLIKWLNS